MDKLAPYRQQIDALDDQIIDLLGKRFDIVRHVAAMKEKENIAVVQPVRMAEVKARNAERGKKVRLDPGFIHRLYDVIIDYAHSMEGELIENGSAAKDA